MENFLQTLKRFGPVRLAALAVALIMMVGLFSIILNRATSSPMALLYANLEPQVAGQMADRLAAMNVKYEVRGDSALYVPSDQVGELRLKMAGEGLVGSGTTGYEIFDDGGSFGTTSLVQNINARRALEGELARTIASLPAVMSARVHLVMPKRKLFATTDTPPSASVALNLGSRTLSDEQVQSIAHLVAAAVPTLSPDKVTVVDNRGDLLSSGESSLTGMVGAQAKIRRQIEQDYEVRLTRMLERVVGPGKASVKVTAEMDFDRVEENAELFDPQMQIVRSEQRIEETLNSSENTTNPAVGVASNVPGQEAGSGGSNAEENQLRAEETINYEISKTLRHHVKQGGTIERLSVAALVEGKYSGASEDGEGAPTYNPHNEEQLEKFTTLVKTAIGYDSSRGDTVEVVDMPFTHVEQPVVEEPMLSKSDYYRIAEYGMLILGMLLIVFMVIRPIMKMKPQSSVASAVAAAAGAQPPVGADGQPVAASQQGGAGSQDAIQVPGQTEESMINIAKVEGQVRESSIKKVIEIMDQYPEESITVIRGWMSADQAEG